MSSTDAGGKQCPTCGTAYGREARFCLSDGTPLISADPKDPLIGTRLDGRYLLMRKIGTGGMGVVYEGVQLSIDRAVAVKLVQMSGEGNLRRRQRFALEARTVARIEHPNVVRVYDFGTAQNDTPYLVMELLKGSSIAQLMVSEGLPLDANRGMELMTQAARGLGAAHRLGLVHRDVKPANLWASQVIDDPDTATVKVLDFGLVKGTGQLDGLTVQGEAVGTPAYMSPEQISGREDVGPASDVYALGVMLYELVVGVPPFQGASTVDILKAHLMDPLPRTTHNLLNQPIPQYLISVWSKAMAKEPSRRYQTADEFREALDLASGPSRMHSVGPLPISGVIVPPDDRELASMDTQEFEAIEHPGLPTGGSLTGAMERERKWITVLSARFYDASGKQATELEERIELIDPVVESWLPMIERQGGVSQLVEGSGVQVAFGLPSAGEDDARRALNTAISIYADGAANTELKSFNLRIGIDTTTVLVKAHPNTPGGYRILGNPFERADAVAAAGAPDGGKPVLSGPAYRTLRRSLNMPLPPVAELQGDSIHLINDPATLTQENVSIDLGKAQRRLIGRNQDLQVLKQWLSPVIETYDGRFGVVIGDVGVGKSALLRAFGAAAREQHPEIRVLAASTGRTPNVPFSLFRRLLLSAADNPTTNIDNTVTLWISVNLAMHSTSVSPEKVNDILRLAGLMDVSAEMAAHPQAWRGRVFSVLGDLMASLSARGGLLLLVDDLEEIDAGSLDLLQYLVRELQSFPFAVLGFDRRLDGVPTIETVHHLEPLDEMQSGLFLHNLMTAREVSAEDMRSILDRACGNPLFLEELAELVCSGKSAFDDALPESLHALLRVQFDHLSVSHRHFLKMASIVGNPFWAGAVAAQMGIDLTRCANSMDSLQQCGLIVRETLSQYAEEEQWCFVRPLLRDVAYESTLKSDRKNGHQMVARWLDSRKNVTPMQHWILLANQEQQAGNLEKAAQNWRRAGEEARRRHAVGQAKQAFIAALALNCGLSPEERDGTHLLLGQLAYQSGDLEMASDELGKVAHNEDAVPNNRMSAIIFLARIAGQSGLIDEQFTLLDTADALTVAADSSTRLKLASDRCFAYASHGRVDEARELMSDFSNRSDVEDMEQDSETRGALANFHLARSYMERVAGRFVAAEAFARKSMTLFESVANDHGVASVLTSLTNVQRILGTFDEALKSSSQAAALFKKSGFVRAEATAWSIHGWTLLEAGKPLDARRVFASTLRLYADSMSWADQVSTAAGDALAAYRMGLNEEARGLANECMNQADEGKSEQVRGWACYAAGIVLEREDLLLECAEIWRKLGRPGWLIHTLTALIEVPNTQNTEKLETELHTLKKRLFAERAHG